jgi:hypothetical protein
MGTILTQMPAVSPRRCIRLEHSDRAPWQARQAVKLWLAKVDPAVRCDALEVVSELVTNVVTHVPPGPQRDWVTVLLGLGDGFIRLEVLDPGTAEPEPRFAPLQAGSLQESGRGLGLVAALSIRRGTHLVEHGHRVVWADLANAAPLDASDSNR